MAAKYIYMYESTAYAIRLRISPSSKFLWLFLGEDLFSQTLFAFHNHIRVPWRLLKNVKKTDYNLAFVYAGAMSEKSFIQPRTNSQ